MRLPVQQACGGFRRTRLPGRLFAACLLAASSLFGSAAVAPWGDEEIFSDGLESGDPSLWSGAVSPIVLESTAFSDGGTIPAAHTCDGINVSPPLSWQGGFGHSYVIVLKDLSNSLVHWVLWDIPADQSAAPEDVAKVFEPPVPAGSKQPLSYNNTTRGYLGPCPGTTHNYEFAIYSLDVGSLPGVSAASSRAQVIAAMDGHVLVTATLTATYTPP